MKQRLLDNETINQIADRVMEKALPRMTATIDAEELVKAIKELDTSIDDLGR